jgi:hypothetical protein
MADHDVEAQKSNERREGPIPVMQEIYDNIWFLFMLSIGIVLISYIIWGLVDMLSIPTLP